MAGLMTRSGIGNRVELNPADVARVNANLRRFDRNLTAGMRAEGQAWGRGLEAALGRAARGAPAPQTHRFAGAASVDSDVAGAAVGATVVITGEGAGFYNDSAVLQATEHGSPLRCFHAPPAGGYWVEPTARAAEGAAVAGARRVTSALVARCNAGG